jgi:hypothetical protein
VSFANSGGGVILFGVNHDGSTDINPILALDPADIANKVRKYTECDLPKLKLPVSSATVHGSPPS